MCIVGVNIFCAEERSDEGKAVRLLVMCAVDSALVLLVDSHLIVKDLGLPEPLEEPLGDQGVLGHDLDAN